MRVLILGANGMLGHKVAQRLSRSFEVWLTLRCRNPDLEHTGLFPPERTIEGVDADDFATVDRAISDVRPAAVVNCIGVIKQSHLAKDPIASIALNAMFPHRLAKLCDGLGLRLIHISTDCVFSGRKGHYKEDDPTDAEDLYGRTKALGELTRGGSLTLRTSIIGRELRGAFGLVEWFLSSANKVQGYTEARFSGLTTLVLADVIESVIAEWPLLRGLYQVAASPISKYDLLVLLRNGFGHTVEIEPCDRVKIDRTLDSTCFREATGFVAPSWKQMVDDLVSDSTTYSHWRTTSCH